MLGYNKIIFLNRQEECAMADHLMESIITAVNNAGPELDQLSKNIYENPELGYQEHKACAWHCALLEKHGFAVERNYCGMETAFRAVYDSGKPGLSAAFLAEYDALPGVGHGCGHNILGAVSDGAAIGLKAVIDELGGRVVLFGTPAEETSGAKVIMAEQGKFDDMDFALMAHPANCYSKSGSSLALMPIQFEFFGKAAHAASDPWNGLNALDAALTTMNAINALRQQMLPTSRIHGVMLDGGLAANVVPEYTRLQYYVRSVTKAYNQELLEKVKNCARAGALAAGCRLEMTRYELPYDNMVTNQTLGNAVYQAMEDVSGIPITICHEAMGSLDAGQVSHVCPTVHFYFDITDGNRAIADHSREMAEATQTEFAKKSARHTAAALALAAARVMRDPALLVRIQEEFNQADK